MWSRNGSDRTILYICRGNEDAGSTVITNTSNILETKDEPINTY